LTKKEKVQRGIKWIVAIIIIVTVGIFAIVAGINIGGLINKLLDRKKEKKAFLSVDGKVIGSPVKIIGRKNPFRDKSLLKTSDGEFIKLPSGMEDTDVENLIKVKIEMKDGEYAVTKKHDTVTDIFDK
jgi:hypothetical protein